MTEIQVVVPPDVVDDKAGLSGKPEKNFDQLRHDFALWLISVDRAGTQNQWAAAHDLDPNRLSEWKHHKDVIAITDGWKQEARRGAYDLAQAVRRRILDTGDPAAYRVYMESIGELKSEIDVNVTEKFSKLQEQLVAIRRAAVESEEKHVN